MTAISAPLVTVIIPVYNVEDYLRECLESVVNQSLGDIEIICINDGSTDRSLDIINEFAKNDRRIRVFNKNNQGQSSARNDALAISSGKYIVFVDADDHVDKNLCLISYTAAEEYNCDIVTYQHINFIDLNEIHCCELEDPTILVRADSARHDLLDDMGVVWNKFIRKDFVEKIEFSFADGLIFEDILAHWQLMSLAVSVVVLKSNLYHYRIRLSATTKRSDMKIADRIIVYDLLWKFLYEKKLLDSYSDLFIKMQLEGFYSVYNNVEKNYRKDVLKMIKNRISAEHMMYAKINKNLDWRARALALSFESIINRSKIYAWMLLRSVYRAIK